MYDKGAPVKIKRNNIEYNFNIPVKLRLDFFFLMIKKKKIMELNLKKMTQKEHHLLSSTDGSIQMQASCIHIVELWFLSIFNSHLLLEFFKFSFAQIVSKCSVYYGITTASMMWLFMKAKQLFIKQIFHKLNSGRKICLSCLSKFSWVLSIRMNHSVLKKIWELMFRFL